jgi:hypothetical protein
LLAHAMNHRLGNVGQTVIHTTSIAARAVDHTESLRALVADMEQGHVEMLLVLGGNPVFTAPRASEPLPERDVAAVPLASSGGPLPGGVERYAGLRGDRLDRVTAHRAALSGALGPRAAQCFDGADRAAGS